MDSIYFLSGILAGAIHRILWFDAETFAILGLSLKVAVVSTVLGLGAALPLAGLIQFCRPRLRTVLFIGMQTLVSVPTVIVGTVVYLLLSRSGPFGALELLYSPAAIIIGDILLVVPLLAVFIGSALQQVPAGYVETAKNLGAKPRHILAFLARECSSAIAIGVCVGFGRVISELGAAMILGGNIKGFSRTLTTAMALEMGKGETELAMALGILLLGVALANTLAVQYLQTRLLRRGHVPERDGSEGISRQNPIAQTDIPPGIEKKTTQPFPLLQPVEIRALTVRFDDRMLFDRLDASLDVSGGIALMGASGSGKTTLLRMIAGLAAPNEGVVDLKERTAIITFQRPYIFKGTVRENMEFGMTIHGLPSELRKSRLDQLSAALGLRALLDCSTRHLSGGEAARVSIGRALAVNPELLLLDEALSHLDKNTLVPIIALLRKFVADGGGLVLVTHEEWLADAICARKAVLENGRIIPIP